MSVLEDARQLMAMTSLYPTKSGPWRCLFCQVDVLTAGGMFDHAPSCPWLAMPRIVAALEADQRGEGQ